MYISSEVEVDEQVLIKLYFAAKEPNRKLADITTKRELIDFKWDASTSMFIIK